MSKPKTYFFVVLDRSGSMYSCVEQTISDFNEKAQMYKNEDAEGEQEVLCSFLHFNERTTEAFWCKSASELQEITQETYRPSGGTALNDAVAFTINKIGETVKLGEDDAGVLIIITDGDENSSKEFPGRGNPAIGKMVKELQEVKNKDGEQQWTVTYMGANQNVEQVSREFAIPAANCALYSTRSAAHVQHANKTFNTQQADYLNARKIRCRAKAGGSAAFAAYQQSDDAKKATSFMNKDAEEVADLTELNENSTTDPNVVNKNTTKK
jgi:hypothetical protein